MATKIFCRSFSSQARNIKITRIQAFQVDLPLHEKSYKWSGGKSVDVFDATVVKIETNVGITGYGENTPLGANYLPAYAAGTRAGIKVEALRYLAPVSFCVSQALSPALIGCDPTKLNNINAVMDLNMKGHPYVKSALDMACWDILGKVRNCASRRS